MRPLMWFRSDLRTDDNRALYHACDKARRGVVGVFAICADQWRQHDWGSVRVEFLLRNVACLREQLLKLNIPLLIIKPRLFADIAVELLRLARRRACDALYFNREYEVNERRRDDAVTELFGEHGWPVAAFDDQTTLPPDGLRTQEGNFYTVFTPFKRAWCERVESTHGVEPLRAPRTQPELVGPPDDLPERLVGYHLSAGLPELWPAGEHHALRQLSDFVTDRIAAYRRRRDNPAIEATSRLSPYLTLGVISPRRCLAEARAANRGVLQDGRAGPTTWISELIWREFYRHILVGYPRVSMDRAFREETDALDWRYDEDEFAAWCAGQTGYPLVDAGLRQLAQTGWMHNRLRMIVAMFLTKDLLLDWRWGERHFMQHLIDGDLASNNGGWQWSASTGTDAAPYFRIFNPTTQSQRFDPDGDFIRAYVPELREVPKKAIHDPPTDIRRRHDYPAPICDHKAGRERALHAFKRLKEDVS